MAGWSGYPRSPGGGSRSLGIAVGSAASLFGHFFRENNMLCDRARFLFHMLSVWSQTAGAAAEPVQLVVNSCDGMAEVWWSMLECKCMKLPAPTGISEQQGVMDLPVIVHHTRPSSCWDWNSAQAKAGVCHVTQLQLFRLWLVLLWTMPVRACLSFCL